MTGQRAWVLDCNPVQRLVLGALVLGAACSRRQRSSGSGRCKEGLERLCRLALPVLVGVACATRHGSH